MFFIILALIISGTVYECPKECEKGCYLRNCAQTALYCGDAFIDENGVYHKAPDDCNTTICDAECK